MVRKGLRFIKNSMNESLCANPDVKIGGFSEKLRRVGLRIVFNDGGDHTKRNSMKRTLGNLQRTGQNSGRQRQNSLRGVIEEKSPLRGLEENRLEKNTPGAGGKF